MGNQVINVYAKFSYDRLRIDKALGFWKSDNNKNKSKNNVRSNLGPLRVIDVGAQSTLGGQDILPEKYIMKK